MRRKPTQVCAFLFSPRISLYVYCKANVNISNSVLVGQNNSFLIPARKPNPEGEEGDEDDDGDDGDDVSSIASGESEDSAKSSGYQAKFVEFEVKVQYLLHSKAQVEKILNSLLYIQNLAVPYTQEDLPAIKEINLNAVRNKFGVSVVQDWKKHTLVVRGFSKERVQQACTSLESGMNYTAAICAQVVWICRMSFYFDFC